MRMLALVFATLVLGLAGAAPCYALNFHSYVSGKGTGTACTLAAPCLDFTDALAATVDGGEVSCIDSGFDISVAFTISKGVTIDCAGVAAAAWRIVINAPNKVVTLRNLTTSDFGKNSNANSSIEFQNGAALFMENCVLENWNTTDNIVQAIYFAPPAGVTAKLYIGDSVIKNIPGTISGGGLSVWPPSGAVADVTIERTRFENDHFGIGFFGNTGGTVYGVVRDSVVAGDNNDVGIFAGTAGTTGTVNVLIENTTVRDNDEGLRAIDAGANMLVSGSSVVHNGTGLFADEGGTLTSFGNNNLSGNTTDGAFTTTIAQQ
jgi:hypothetical protein